MDDKEIMERLSEYFELLNPSSSYIISFSPFFVNQASSSLMKYMVDQRGKSGLYICIGRPHIFIERILSSKNVNSKNIIFMDMAMHIGKRSHGGGSNKIEISEGDGELDVPGTFKLFRYDQELKSIKFTDIDLVVLDNVTELEVYNNPDQIREFLKVFLDAANKLKKGLILYNFKTGKNNGLVQTAEDMGIDHIEIPDSVLKD